MLTFGSVVIGIDDLTRASTFWRAALGYRPREEPDEIWAILVPSDRADDPAAEVERLTALGAEEQEREGAVAVLEDTEGNRFCVIGHS